MPHYRINIKLEKQSVKEYIIEDGCKDIDLVYGNYRRRVIQKNGSGRVIYFDLVMIAEDSLKHLGDREEIYHEQNNFGIDDLDLKIEPKKPKRFHAIKLTLAERNEKTRE